MPALCRSSIVGIVIVENTKKEKSSRRRQRHPFFSISLNGQQVPTRARQDCPFHCAVPLLAVSVSASHQPLNSKQSSADKTEHTFQFYPVFSQPSYCAVEISSSINRLSLLRHPNSFWEFLVRFVLFFIFLVKNFCVKWKLLFGDWRAAPLMLIILSMVDSRLIVLFSLLTVIFVEFRWGE